MGVNATPPPGKTRCPLYRRLSGPRERSGQVRKISSPPRFDPRTVQPVASRYTDCATRYTRNVCRLVDFWWCSSNCLYTMFSARYSSILQYLCTKKEKEVLDAISSGLAIVPTEDTIVLRYSQFCQADWRLSLHFGGFAVFWDALGWFPNGDLVYTNAFTSLHFTSFRLAHITSCKLGLTSIGVVGWYKHRMFQHIGKYLQERMIFIQRKWSTQ